ncbi:MAG: hypothetical protein ACK4YF_04785 [Exilispira sp.]
MKIVLSTKFINKILKKLSGVSNTPILDFTLIYKKYSKKNPETSRIISEISGRNKRLTIDILFLLPFLFDLRKRMNFYPVAYITKSKYFYDSEFYIQKGVLIPRSESEILVDLGFLFYLELILKILFSFENNCYLFEQLKKLCKEDNEILFLNYEDLLRFLDKLIYKYFKDIFRKYNFYENNKNNKNFIRFSEFCSGSAAITISLINKIINLNYKLYDKLNNDLKIDINFIPQSYCYEISNKAILIAKKNAEIILGKNFKVIKFYKCDILKDGLNKFIDDEKIKFDFILANPPYISKEDFNRLPYEVRRYEPKIALNPGKEQNIFYKRIIYLASYLLKENGYIGVEVSDDKHAVDIVNLFKSSCYEVLVIKDFQNIARVVAGKKI